MDNISNRTLVVLISIAIFFILFGTTTILGSLGQPVPFITGLLSTTAEGQVSVVVAETTSIRIIGSNVSFGNGSAVDNVSLSTASGTDNPSTFNDPSNAAADDFLIENDGNVDVNLTLNGSSAADFITTGTAPLYNFSAKNSSNLLDNGCIVFENSSGQSGAALNSSQIPFGVGSVAPSICNNFTFRNLNDTINVTINLFLPGDTEPQNYTDVDVLFTAVHVFA